jgi:HTH-type transcriptional regulator, sugar sensing transcriptional regulator
MLEKYLQDIGLSEKESVVYIALLAVDNSSVLDLSKKTKLNRSTAYVILESLAKKGLVTETTIGKKTHYQAEPPERLETYVEQRKIMLEEQAKKLKDIIPQIKSVQREGGEKPLVKYFDGREGLVSLNEEFFVGQNENSVSYLIYSKDLLDEIFTKQEKEKYRSMRLNKKIKSKVIYTYKNGEIPSSTDGDRVKIDADKYPILCDISISDDKIKIAMLGKKLSGIYIKSKEFAETLRSLFNVAYDEVKKKGAQS